MKQKFKVEVEIEVEYNIGDTDIATYPYTRAGAFVDHKNFAVVFTDQGKIINADVVKFERKNENGNT